jgi:hypothetical protein
VQVWNWYSIRSEQLLIENIWLKLRTKAENCLLKLNQSMDLLPMIVFQPCLNCTKPDVRCIILIVQLVLTYML